MHTVILQNLLPGTTYYYRVGDKATSVWSSESSFRAPTGPSLPVRLLIFGDMGTAPTDGSQQHSFDNANHGEVAALNTTQRLLQELASPSASIANRSLHKYRAESLPAAIVHIGNNNKIIKQCNANQNYSFGFF